MPTKKQLQDVEKKLTAEREELLKQMEELDRQTHTAQSEASGEASFEPDEFADAGTATFERERDFSLAANVKDILEQVEHALERVSEGTYGTCESCGKAIAADRLRALPHASLCIDCKKLEERRR